MRETNKILLEIFNTLKIKVLLIVNAIYTHKISDRKTGSVFYCWVNSGNIKSKNKELGLKSL